MIERRNRKAFVPSPRRSSRCRLDAPNESPFEKKKLSKRLTWKQGSEGGRTADGNVVLIFPPALGNRLAFYDFFFSSSLVCPQNNLQQVFQRLHALLQEEYSGEDLQIIACPSTEQVSGSAPTFLRWQQFAPACVYFVHLFCAFLPR